MDGMEVHLSPEIQAKLNPLAAQQGRNTKSLAHEAVERLAGNDEWFMGEVKKCLAAADRGDFALCRSTSAAIF
jgi:predicted transcriptional regulator